MGDSLNATYGGFKIQYIENNGKFCFVLDRTELDSYGILSSNYHSESTFRFYSKHGALAAGIDAAKEILEELKVRNLVK